MIHPKVNGRWLREVGIFGEVTWSSSLRGSESATWRMPRQIRPELPRGSPVTFHSGGDPLWAGTLTEPSDNLFVAEGLWKQAEGALALDGGGAASFVPDTAIDAAIARGAVSWTRPASISASTVANDGEPLYLLDLLDRWADAASSRWQVDGAGAVRSYAASPGVDWHVTPGTTQLALSDDKFASTLFATYMATSTTFGVTSVANTTRWGVNERKVDLTDLGVISAGTAQTYLAGMLAKGAARLTYSESLELASGQITNTGGAPAPLEAITGGQVIRVHGVGDETQPTLLTTYSDVTLGGVEYADGARTIKLTPAGLAPRDLEGLLRVVA